MVKPAFYIFILTLFLTINIIAGTDYKEFYGIRYNNFAVIKISDSCAFAEYYYTDRNNITHCHFDTLSRIDGKFTGKYSKMIIKNNTLIFTPGNIRLKDGIPDSSLNIIRNSAFINYLSDKLKISLGWTGFNFEDFNNFKLNQIPDSDPNIFRQTFTFKYDSIYQKYTSIIITRNYSSVTVRNDRLFTGNLFVSTDSIELLRVWKVLSSGKPLLNSNLPFLVQYPVALVPLSFFNFDVAVLSTPFIYPVLIGTEKIIINRINAGKTLVISFISKDNNSKNCVIRIRNSTIIGNNYNYLLPFSFEDKLFFKTYGSKIPVQ